jgi:hypothetical protein
MPTPGHRYFPMWKGKSLKFSNAIYSHLLFQSIPSSIKGSALKATILNGLVPWHTLIRVPCTKCIKLSHNGDAMFVYSPDDGAGRLLPCYTSQEPRRQPSTF